MRSSTASSDFLDCITEAFPDLAAVADGTLAPQKLRETPLLGSTGMLRILAAVYRNLIEKGADSQEITDFFRSLNPRHDGAGDGAVRVAAGPRDVRVVEDGAYAPVMRQQNLTYIVDAITNRYKK